MQRRWGPQFAAWLPRILLLWQALWLWHFAATADWCCDAAYYLQTGKVLWEQGLYYTDFLAGYRPYLTPLVVGAIGQFPLDADMIPNVNKAFSFNASVLFVAISAVLTWALRSRLSLRQWLLLSLPTLFNPFFLADLVVPLQESATLFVALPMIVIVGACLIRRRFEAVAFMVVALAGFVTMTRTSNAITGLPALVLCAAMWWSLRADPRRRLKLSLAAAGGLVVAILLLLPQLSINQHHFKTWVSPRYGEIARLQLQHGADLMRYGTAFEDGEWKGVRIKSAWYNYVPGTDLETPYKEIGWLAVPQVLAHFYAGLHVDEPRTYWSRGRPNPAGGWMIFSALIVILGAAGIARDLRRRPMIGWTLLSMVAVSIASTAMLAVESRFGIWGQIGLALGAARFLFAQPRPSRPALLAAVVVSYVAIAVAVNMWLWSHAL